MQGVIAGAAINAVGTLVPPDLVTAGSAGHVLDRREISEIIPTFRFLNFAVIVAENNVDRLIKAREVCGVDTIAAIHEHDGEVVVSSNQRVIVSLAIQEVAAEPSFDQIVAIAAMNGVVPPAAAQPVVGDVADDRVVAITGDDVLDQVKLGIDVGTSSSGISFSAKYIIMAGCKIDCGIGIDRRRIDGVDPAVAVERDKVMLAIIICGCPRAEFVGVDVEIIGGCRRAEKV